MHPLATERLEQLGDADLTDANIEAATSLGLLFKVSDVQPGRSRVEVAKRIAALDQIGLATRSLAGLAGDRARILHRARMGVPRGRAWPATRRCS